MKLSKTPIVFINPDVAAKYASDNPTDPVVHVPGIYRGKLSTIPVDAADALIKQGSNLVTVKPPTGKQPPAVNNSAGQGANDKATQTDK